jgi:hypothetical protein
VLAGLFVVVTVLRNHDGRALTRLFGGV